MRSRLLAIAALAAVIISMTSALTPVSAQNGTVQARIIADVLAEGWWDEASVLSADDMGPVVSEWGDEFAFAITDRALVAADDPERNAAALLAQSTLELLVAAGGPETLFVVTETQVGGASTERPFLNLMSALEDFDRSAPEASFARAAELATSLGTEVQAVAPAQTGFLADGRLFILLGIIVAILALASLRSSRKKKSRRVNTIGARDDTRAQLQAMSDRIIDLDPRITIADDPELKARYVEASDTYREVLEAEKDADTGHEVADLRVAIAKARWKLDVIDAELEGQPSPPEPFTRDTSGSAWDSTRGSGAHDS